MQITCRGTQRLIRVNTVRHPSSRFNPMPNGFFYLHSDRSISNIRGVWLDFIITVFYIKKKSVFNANSVDADQTPRYAASDLGLHCLPMSQLLDARPKWVKTRQQEAKWNCSNFRAAKVGDEDVPILWADTVYNVRQNEHHFCVIQLLFVFINSFQTKLKRSQQGICLISKCFKCYENVIRCV